MIPLNRPQTTLALKMPPEAWRNVAECAMARHRAAADAEDWQGCDGEFASSSVAFNQARLAREPFPIVVADGIRHNGKIPQWDNIVIDRDWHIEQSVNGEPEELPDYLDEAICDEDRGWKDLVCIYLKATDDRNRDYDWHPVDFDGEHDLSGDVFAVVFCPADSPDHLWADDTYLCVDGKLYSISDSTIADCDILETAIGWHVATLADGDFLDGFDRLSAGHSSNPTGELRKMLEGGSEPIWHHALNCFVGRLTGHPEPVRLCPVTPYYGG